MIVYISIGNSDDKLTQSQWHDYMQDVDLVFDYVQIHGRWFSEPISIYQSACWCVEFDPDRIVDNSPHYADWDGTWRNHTETTRRALASTQRELRAIARRYRQDSIAWAEVPSITFLRPEEDENANHHDQADRTPPADRDGPEPAVRPAGPSPG